MAAKQVAGQQGAYVARMINKGYKLGTGGLEQPFPARWKESSHQEVWVSSNCSAKAPCNILPSLL